MPKFTVQRSCLVTVFESVDIEAANSEEAEALAKTKSGWENEGENIESEYTYTVELAEEELSGEALYEEQVKLLMQMGVPEDKAREYLDNLLKAKGK